MPFFLLLSPLLHGLTNPSITLPSSPTQLEEYGITHVLTLLANSTRPRIPPSLGIVHKRVEIEDDALSDLLCVLEGVCAWVEDALGSPATGDHQVLKEEEEEKRAEGAKEPRVLVHCLQGISRSGAVVIACLMRRLDVGYEEALEMARSCRPLITANEGFAKQLQLWHQMRYSIYENEPTNAEGEPQERKLKSLYLGWKMERDGLLKLGEEEVNKRRAKSMASMAAQFGERRLEMKKRVDEAVRGNRQEREEDSE